MLCQTEEEIEGIKSQFLKDHPGLGLVHHHTATGSGYISRKCAGYVHHYDGRFGYGLTVHRPRTDTTKYHYVEYWVLEELE